MLRVANSTPIVDLDSKLNSLRVNLDRRLLLPTPESPINTTEKEISFFVNFLKRIGMSNRTKSKTKN